MSNDADSRPPAHAVRRGVLFGVVAGLAFGAVWYVIVLGTTSMQTYLIPAFGIVVSYAVWAGMRRPGVTAAVISVVITAVAVLLSTYYVERHLVLKWYAENDDSISIPLVPFLDWVVEVVRHALTKSVSPPVYSALALVAAGWFGHEGFDPQQPNQRSRQPG